MKFNQVFFFSLLLLATYGNRLSAMKKEPNTFYVEPFNESTEPWHRLHFAIEGNMDLTTIQNVIKQELLEKPIELVQNSKYWSIIYLALYRNNFKALNFLLIEFIKGISLKKLDPNLMFDVANLAMEKLQDIADPEIAKSSIEIMKLTKVMEKFIESNKYWKTIDQTVKKENFDIFNDLLALYKKKFNSSDIINNKDYQKVLTFAIFSGKLRYVKKLIELVGEEILLKKQGFFHRIVRVASAQTKNLDVLDYLLTMAEKFGYKTLVLEWTLKDEIIKKGILEVKSQRYQRKLFEKYKEKKFYNQTVVIIKTTDESEEKREKEK